MYNSIFSSTVITIIILMYYCFSVNILFVIQFHRCSVKLRAFCKRRTVYVYVHNIIFYVGIYYNLLYIVFEIQAVAEHTEKSVLSV